VLYKFTQILDDTFLVPELSIFIKQICLPNIHGSNLEIYVRMCYISRQNFHEIFVSKISDSHDHKNKTLSNFPSVKEPVRSLPPKQEPVTGSYPKRDKSSPYLHIIFL